MTTSVKGQAFVLKKRKLPGQNIVLTFFSEEHGKIGLFARGAAKLTSRRSPHLQTGNLIDFIAHKKESNWYLSETSLVSGFQQVKKDPNKLNHQYLFLYILDRLLAEGQREEKIYTLTKKFFIDLSENSSFNNTHSERYINHVLQSLGYTTEPKTYSEIATIMHDLTHSPLPAFSFT